MLKILVAEDDVSTNKLLCAILKINGYEAIPAFNGEDGAGHHRPPAH